MKAITSGDAELLARVDQLLIEVKRLRFIIWSRAWANGKHQDAPPCPAAELLASSLPNAPQ